MMNSISKKFFLGLFLIVILSLSFYKNIFAVVSDGYFDRFQYDSEALVAGYIVVQQKNLPITPRPGHLASVGVQEINLPLTLYQAFPLLDNKILEPFSSTTADINDDNWDHGISRKFAGLIVDSNAALEQYAGRKLTVLGQTRVIKLIEHEGPYTRVKLSGDVLAMDVVNGDGVTFSISGDPVDTHIAVKSYPAQYGIQGIILSSLYEPLGGKLSRLHLLNSILLALVITALCFLFARVFSIQFSIIFLLSIVFSPWVVPFAKNLYWVAFTWFLPALFAAWYFLSANRSKKILYSLLLYLAFTFKCLAGYEYISTIILFAAAPFFYHAIATHDPQYRWRNVKGFFIVCLIGVAGFLTALLLHATMRGDTIWAGLKHIYEWDVLRRTYGDPDLFKYHPLVVESLKASTFDVLNIYFSEWSTPLLKHLPGTAFVPLVVVTIGVLGYRMMGPTSFRNRNDLALFITFFLPPLSWFVLAKAHSYIHFHMNFVLWYFGFVAALFHILFNALKRAVLHFQLWLKTARIEEI